MTLRVAAVGPQGFGTYALEDSHLTPTGGDAEAILAPGFFDIHVHGGNGIDVMDASPDDMRRLCVYLADRGYEGFLPTTVTAPAGDVNRVLADLPSHEMIAGVHLEGPFISPEHPGAQPKEWIVPVPGAKSEWTTALTNPRVRVVTLAPELPGARDLISRLTQRGIRVGMGHTHATYAEAEAGFRAGATHTTHTFNAMRTFHHREAGVAGFALAEPAVACELIYDRLHVCPDAARLLIKSKPQDKVIAVSDGTAASGLPKGTRLSMWRHEAIVGDGDVRLTDGALAGSAITLLDAFQNLAADFGIETAIRATSLNPRKLLGYAAPPRVHLLFDLRFGLLERRTTSATV
ncbi:MAG: N-acetylglucosamine-6-phosphate deacetylase [Fimbriimonadaceae bacterium]